MKILVVGATGLIGSTVLRVLSERSDWKVVGTLRSEQGRRYFEPRIAELLVPAVDVLDHDALVRVVERVRPSVIINCAGLTKHKPKAEDPLFAIPINSLMPHRLARLAKLTDSRVIHISTDCVFSGQRGRYTEEDFADARDVYGKSKALGEISYPHAVTLRTSTIGHELNTKYGLLEWFLSQQRSCAGYTNAIFSGLPTVVLAQVIRDVVVPRQDLTGLYHVAAEPISKFDLLTLIAEVYGKSIEIVADDRVAIDRSLDGRSFRAATGYVPPSWKEMIKVMHGYN